MAWPTTNDPRTEFVTLRLTVGEAADLDWLQAQIGGKNRSDTARSAFYRVVAAERKRAARQKKSSAPGPGMRDPEDSDDDE